MKNLTATLTSITLAIFSATAASAAPVSSGLSQYYSRRTMRALLLAVSGLTLGTGVFAAIAPEAHAAPARSPLDQTSDSPCVVIPQSSSSPSTVTLGDTIEVVLRTSIRCPLEVPRIHAVLVMDGSGRNSAGMLKAMKDSAKAFVRSLELGVFPSTRVRVVEFKHSSDIVCDLTSTAARITGCINSVTASGGTSIDSGIKRGMQIMANGRAGLASRTALREVMVVYSAGPNNSGCAPVIAEAARAKGQSVILFTVCTGPACDKECLLSVATSERHNYHIDDADALADEAFLIATEPEIVRPRLLNIWISLPRTMWYVSHSSEHPPVVGSPLDRPEWLIADFPSSEVTITLRLEPREIGVQPVSSEIQGTFSDTQSRSGEIFFEIPAVEVVAPEPTATPSPMPTPTPEPLWPLYLPASYRQHRP